MKHIMQEMSPAELEATSGGLFKEIFSVIGELIDLGIAAIKQLAGELKAAYAEWRRLYG